MTYVHGRQEAQRRARNGRGEWRSISFAVHGHFSLWMISWTLFLRALSEADDAEDSGDVDVLDPTLAAEWVRVQRLDWWGRLHFRGSNRCRRNLQSSSSVDWYVRRDRERPKRWLRWNTWDVEMGRLFIGKVTLWEEGNGLESPKVVWLYIMSTLSFACFV